MKRVRQDAVRRERNRTQRSRMRTMMKKLRSIDSRDEAAAYLPEVKAYLDRLAGKRVIHRNKAANYKSELEHHVNGLA